ncbi:MAG TPA: outer membrane protein assembly factor BamE [Burkholderiales bacterium]|nr:outer membrane protein assembly factor BamE [Burkholderiales bacterium]
MRYRLIFLALFLTACSPTVLITPHKIDVQQGNVVTQDMLDKVKPGMTKSQVRFVLGTPLISDPFHANRWDYVYRFNKAGKLTESRKLTAVFEGDKLKEIEGAALPPSDKIAGTRPVELIVPDKTDQTQPAAVAAAPEQPNPPLPPVEGLKLKLDSNLAESPQSIPAIEAKPATAQQVQQAQTEQPKRGLGERFLRLFGFGKKDEVQQAKAEEKSEAQPEPEAEAEQATNTVVTADRTPPPKRSVGERFMRLIGFKEKVGDDPAPPVTTETQNRPLRIGTMNLKDLVVKQILGFGDDTEKERKALAEDIEPGESEKSGAQGTTWQRFKRLIGVGSEEQEPISAPAKNQPQRKDQQTKTEAPESTKTEGTQPADDRSFFQKTLDAIGLGSKK